MSKAYILIVTGWGYVSHSRLIQALKLEELEITTEEPVLSNKLFLLPRTKNKKGKKGSKWRVVKKLGPVNRVTRQGFLA